MKILRLSHLQDLGSPDRSLEASRTGQAIQKLLEASHEIRWLCVDDKIRETKKIRWTKETIENGGLIYACDGRPHPDWLWNSQIALLEQKAEQIFSQEKWRPDIIWSTSPSFFYALAGRHLAEKHSIPLVLELREHWPNIALTQRLVGDPNKIRLLKQAEQQLYSSASRIIVPTQSLKLAVIQSGAGEGKTTLIDDPKNANFAPDRELGENFRANNRICGRRPFVLVESGVEADSELSRGLLHVPQIAAKIAKIDPSVLFLTIGSGFFFSRTLSAAYKLGARRQLIGHPPVPSAVRCALLQAADLYLSLTGEFHHNPPAAGVLDALSVGTPIAYNHRGPLADLLLAARAGIPIDTDDPDWVAQQLITVLRDPRWRTHARQNAVELSNAPRFALDSYVDALSQTFEEAIDPPQSESNLPRPDSTRVDLERSELEESFADEDSNSLPRTGS